MGPRVQEVAQDAPASRAPVALGNSEFSSLLCTSFRPVRLPDVQGN